MTEIDASILTSAELAPMLRNWAQGVLTIEAAINLIINHDVWLRRTDFLRACVVVAEDGIDGGTDVSMAAVSWHWAAIFANGAAASRSELAVLRLACSLGGVNTGALGDLASGLDPANAARVLDAVAHGTGWHEQGIRHTVDGRQDRDRGPSLRV